MLEPAVRPGQGSPSAKRAPAAGEAAAFESKSFEELFRELGDAPIQTPSNSETSSEAGAGDPVQHNRAAADPLAPLHTIENASLSRLLADRSDPPNDAATPNHRAA
jgi:hypothetical protein